MIKKNKKKYLNYFFFIFFIILSLTSLPSKEDSSGGTTMHYLIILAFVGLSVAAYGIKSFFLKKINYNYIDLIPLLFLLVWLYGVFVGLLNNVPEKYVFRNFGGMVFYLIFYFFYVIKLNLFTIIRSVIFSAIIGIPVIFYITYLALINGDISGVGGERVVFCFLQMIIFIPFVLIFGNIFFPLQELKKELIFKNSVGLLVVASLCYFSSVIISFSKGMILASFLVMFLIFVLRIFKGISFKIFIRISLIVFLFIFLLIYFDLFSTLQELFSNKEVSNATRSIQSVYLIDDLTFFGRGLGSGLTNVSYTRADDAPYGFELTYLNLMHKFGFMSLILFAIYIYTFIKIFRLFGKSAISNFSGLLCLGLMAYVFPSIGNPFLLAPLAIVCHCLTLYILKLNDNNSLSIN